MALSLLLNTTGRNSLSPPIQNANGNRAPPSHPSKHARYSYTSKQAHRDVAISAYPIKNTRPHLSLCTNKNKRQYLLPYQKQARDDGESPRMQTSSREYGSYLKSIFEKQALEGKPLPRYTKKTRGCIIALSVSKQEQDDVALSPYLNQSARIEELSPYPNKHVRIEFSSHIRIRTRGNSHLPLSKTRVRP